VQIRREPVAVTGRPKPVSAADTLPLHQREGGEGLCPQAGRLCLHVREFCESQSALRTLPSVHTFYPI